MDVGWGEGGWVSRDTLHSDFSNFFLKDSIILKEYTFHFHFTPLSRFLHNSTYVSTLKDTIQSNRILVVMLLVQTINIIQVQKGETLSVGCNSQSRCQEVKPELSLMWVGKKIIKIYIHIVFYSLQNTLIYWSYYSFMYLFNKHLLYQKVNKTLSW